MIAALANHLWQSTLAVIVAAALVRLAGSSNPAVRHRIWLAASLKFLVPFAVLTAAGRALADWAVPFVASPAMPAGLQAIGQPFSLVITADAGASAAPDAGWLVATAFSAVWLGGCAFVLVGRWTAWRRAVALARSASDVAPGRETDSLARACARFHINRPIAIRESVAVGEPGLIGVRRPVLVWPAGLSSRLTDAELDAIVAHEVCHARRGDNAAALLHMLTEVVFWFHPVVWWLGARLVNERERACDREVLRQGADSRTYAESLLNVGRFCLHPPAPFVAGITSSRLSQRVEDIMTYRPQPALTRARRAVLVVTVVVACAGPIVAGAATDRALDLEALPTVVSVALPAVPADVPVTVSRDVTVDVTPAVRPDPRPVTPRGRDRRAPSPRPDAATATVRVAPADVTRQDDEIFRLGPGITNPMVLKEVRPVYPTAAMDARIQGVVALDAVVRADGTVGAVTLREARLTPPGEDHGLVDAAMAAARGWLFKPAMRNGTPVSVFVVLELRFALEPSAAEKEFGKGAYRPDTARLVAPQVQRSVNPNYTPEAMRRQIQGTVEIEAVIDADGTVGDARVVRSLDPGLDGQAMLALGKWHFVPATLDGKAVPAVVTLTLSFRLH